ncbi:hypothetical protein BV22DRAFT_1048603, partial [Leucogyrophana mollusca]
MSASFIQRLADYHTLKKPKRDYKQYRPVTGEMTFFTLSSSSSQYLNAPPAPSRKRSQLLRVPRDDVDEFLSSDLELSFASTMSLNSPPRDTIALTPETERDEPMDISPAPVKAFQKENLRASKPITRPRAFTSAARMFGNDVSNGTILNESSGSFSKPPSSQSNPKRTQWSALPLEWLSSSRPTNTFKPEAENLFACSQNEPASPASEDAMDVDPVSL